MKTACQFCTEQFDYEPILGLPFELKPTVCAPCDERQKASAISAIEAEKYERWKAMCPPVYQDTDPNHPRMPTAQKQAQILNWKFGPKGLLLHGVTRRAKTRCAWLLLKRLIIEGYEVRALTSGEFALQCATAHGASAEAASAWFYDIAYSDVLFIDDLGKCKLTERVEAVLFEMIDFRCARCKPLIITTNFIGKTLIATMTPDRGAPLVARLQEYCQSIHL
jgi:DNA replication protein DnaC